MRLKNFRIVSQIAGTELRVIFCSPVAWLILVVFAVQCGIAFCDVLWPIVKHQSLGHKGSALTGSIFGGSNGVFPVMLEYLYFYVPLLTMGLMSREFSSGSVKLLFSSPVTSGQIVLGKYFSVMIYCAVLLSVLFLYVILGLFFIEHLDVGLIFSNLLGMYLLICAYAVIGLFMSCLTSYQVVAAIGTLAFLSFLNYVGSVGQDISFVRDITYWLALNGRAGAFVAGLISTENVIYFLVVIVAFLLFSVWRLSSVREKQSGMSIWLKLSGVVVGVVVVSYFSSSPMLTWYWDMTATRSNTISETSQRLLHQLDGELRITTYVNLLDVNYASGLPTARKEDFERFRPYMRFKRNLKLDYVYYYDHAENKYLDGLYPGLSDREKAEKICNARGLDMGMFLTPEEIRQQVDLSGEQNRFVRRIQWKGEKEVWLRVYKDMYCFPSEHEISAALKSLLVKPPRVAFLAGHGGRGINSRKDESYTFFSNELTLRNSLINQGFEITRLALADKTEIPETVDILVIADTKEALGEDECRMIAGYIDRGGNLMVLGEPGTQAWMNPIVRHLGVEFREGILLQHREGYHSSLVAAGFALEGMEKFPAFRKLQKYGFCLSMPRCTGLALQDKGFEVTPVAWACDSNSWLADRIYSEDSLKMSCRPEYSSGERWPVIVALSREVSGKEQRIWVAGDADCVSNGELTRVREGFRTANFSLITEAFRWLAQDEFPVSLQTLPSRDNHLCLVRKDMPWLKFGTMGVFPCLLALAYGVIHYRRKRY